SVAVQSQYTLVDRSCPGVGAGARQGQRAGPGLEETTLTIRFRDRGADEQVGGRLTVRDGEGRGSAEAQTAGTCDGAAGRGRCGCDRGDPKDSSGRDGQGSSV